MNNVLEVLYRSTMLHTTMWAVGLVLTGCQTTPAPVTAPIQAIHVGTLMDKCPPLPKVTLADTANESTFLTWFGLFTKAHEKCVSKDDALIEVLEKAQVIVP